jgi:hypothetical protein
MLSGIGESRSPPTDPAKAAPAARAGARRHFLDFVGTNEPYTRFGTMRRAGPSGGSVLLLPSYYTKGAR